MLARLRPWQAAAAVVAVLLVVQTLLLVLPGGSTDAGADEPAPLSVQPPETVVAGVFLLAVFAVLWLVFTLVARVRSRRG
ncbi:hypothetical protein [Solicola sp. PLA-1-18]|uniref:hypothetical protein n=1 Tax=Solicola sp. PLA-1-18 TaxID=3380532 RepID=UPI003B808089